MMATGRFRKPAAVTLTALIFVGCAQDRGSQEPQVSVPPQGTPVASDEGARLYDGFGNYTREVTTRSPEAQKWFDQGMQLLYGFNHDEAIRSFARAAAIDSDCPMAFWGVAYANGLHINNPQMSEAKSRAAYAAAQQAMERLEKASPPEQALIRAVARRYAAEPPQDRRPLDEAYAAAMQQAWQAHGNDPDIGALYAESLMNLQPWDYWTHDGQPKGRIEEIVGVLEAVIAMRPDHPGANHFYIHAVEASEQPERAEGAADRLLNLVPGSGHLVHMPSHIFIRVGRYNDAVESNARASAVDEAYFAVAPKPDFYSLYYLHNVHFLAYASMMEGNYGRAMEAARRLEKQAPPDFVRDYVTMADGIMPVATHVLVRFGKWDEMLAEPEPPEFRKISSAMRHYGRSISLTNLDRLDEAQKELEAFDGIAESVGDEWFIGNNAAKVVLTMARHMAAGELAYRRGNRDEAFNELRAAVKMEDELVYDEPPGWMQPVRHALGALLLGDNRFSDAEAVFREDLQRHPHNGWALLGLEQALRGLGEREQELAQVAAAREKAWAASDVTPPSSCYCAPVAEGS